MYSVLSINYKIAISVLDPFNVGLRTADEFKQHYYKNISNIDYGINSFKENLVS